MIQRLSSLVYSPSGWGKSWLGSTTPGPRLIIDLEGRAGYTPNGQGAVAWDGMSDPRALPESSTQTYIVTTTDLGILDRILQWAVAGMLPVMSITIDSLMFAQMRAKHEIKPGIESLQTQDWGTLLRKMENTVTYFHDLTLKPETGIKCVVFLAGSTDKNGIQVPLMQGQIAGKLPFLVDLAGYLHNARDAEGTLIRQLIVTPYPDRGIRDVKDGTHLISKKLGGVINEPNFEVMFNALTPDKEAA